MATKKSSAKKSAVKKYPTRSGKKSATPPSKRWSGRVTTDSTKPGPGLFKQSAKKIAEGLVKKSVSPKGPGQAMQMLNFYENRGGKNLPAERKRALEGAKKIIRAKEGKAPAKSPVSKPVVKKSATKKSATKRTTKKSAAKKASN